MTNQLDLAFEVTGATVRDSATGIEARPWSTGNWGESFVLIIDQDASDWMFEAIPPGAYQIADEEWTTEEHCDICGEEYSACEHGILRAYADAIDAVTSNPEEWRGYMMARQVVWFPLGKEWIE